MSQSSETTDYGVVCLSICFALIDFVGCSTSLSVECGTLECGCEHYAGVYAWRDSLLCRHDNGGACPHWACPPSELPKVWDVYTDR